MKIIAIFLAIASANGAIAQSEHPILMAANPLLSPKFRDSIAISTDQLKKLEPAIEKAFQATVKLQKRLKQVLDSYPNEEERTRFLVRAFEQESEAIAGLVDDSADRVLSPEQELVYSAFMLKSRLRGVTQWEGYVAKRLKLTQSQQRELLAIEAELKLRLEKNAIDPESRDDTVVAQGKTNANLLEKARLDKVRVLDKRQLKILTLALELKKQEKQK